MPLLVFIVLAVLCLALLGFACACFDDQFAQAFERMVQTPVAVMDVWALSLAAVLLSVAAVSSPATRRPSPALLQRFLF
jgi:hypothetical protein